MAAAVVAQHMTYVENSGQKAAADEPLLSQNTGETSLSYHGNRSLLIMAFMCTRTCVFRLLLGTPLDCASLVHTSSHFKSHFFPHVLVFELIENKQRLKLTSCGALVYLCLVALLGREDRLDRSSAARQQKLAP